MLSLEFWRMLGKGVLETLYMTLGGTLLAYILGLPMGLLLVASAPNGVKPNKPVFMVLGTIVNMVRSVPFVILMVAVLPLSRIIFGTSLGSTAMLVPLFLGAAPFVARLVESSALEVDNGVIEAARSMGATPLQIVLRVILPEALPSLITGSAIAVTTILGYSAMSGFTGGGGIGDIAIRYGYYRYETDIMLICAALLVVIVQLMQAVGNGLSRKSDKRIR